MRACMHACMRVCVHACVRACVCACMRVCVHACMRACMRACVRACVCVLRAGAKVPLANKICLILVRRLENCQRLH